MRDPFRQTWGIGRGSRRMACSLRQGAGNLWTATYWCGSSKACAQTPSAQPTTSNDSAAGIRLYTTVCGRVCASAFGLRNHMRRHKEMRWAASSSDRRTTKRERERERGFAPLTRVIFATEYKSKSTRNVHRFGQNCWKLFFLVERTHFDSWVDFLERFENFVGW